MRASRFLSLVFLLASASALKAQTDPLQHEGTFVFPWFVLGEPWRPNAMRVGDFDSDGMFDLVLDTERNGAHKLLYVGAVIGRDVATYIEDAFATAAPEVLAFDVAPHLAGIGGAYAGMTRSALVCTSASGLHVGYLLPSSGELPARFVFDQLESSQWSDVPLVRAADIDLDGVTDFVGLKDGGLGVLVMRGADLTTTLFTTASPIITLDVLRWDTVGQPELAILTHTGVEVRTASGTVITAFPSTPNANGLMTVLRGQFVDRLAWIRRTASQATLSALSSAGGLDGPHVLPISQPVSIAAGDVDRDRHADILIGSALRQAPTYFRNQRPSIPMFDVNSGWAVNACIERIVMDENLLPSLELVGDSLLGTAAFEARCAPLMADLDGDGRCDAIVPSYVPGTGTTNDLALLVFTGTKPEVEPYDACPDPPVAPLQNPPSACPPQVNRIYAATAKVDGSYSTPHLKYSLWMKYNASSCPPNADTIGVSVWRQLNETSPIEPKALHDYRFPIVAQGAWHPNLPNWETQLDVYVDGALLNATPTIDDRFCSAEVLWFEIKTMRTIGLTTPLVFNTRYVAADMAMQSSEVLILDGGVELCNPGEPTLCPPPFAPEGTLFVATTGPIYIVRRPRLPSPGPGAILELPPPVIIGESGAPGYLGPVITVP